MPSTYQQKRYSRTEIEQFVSTHSDVLVSTPLTSQQLSSKSDLFEATPSQPDGPLDLVYLFANESTKPALGFQQIDTEQDDQEIYALVYVDPGLAKDF